MNPVIRFWLKSGKVRELCLKKLGANPVLIITIIRIRSRMCIRIKCIRMKIFLLFQKFIQKLTWMLWRQVRLGNNLPTHVRENTDSSRQKPRQLLGAEANFEGCHSVSLLPNFQKEGGLTGSQFEERVCCERRGDFFRKWRWGGLQFLHKK